MKTKVVLTVVFTFAFCLFTSAFAGPCAAQRGLRLPDSQTKKNTQQRPAESPTPTPTPTTPQADEDEGQEVDDGSDVKVETNLVVVPVIASDRGGRYVPDLKAEEFSVSEDGTPQEVAFFATVTEPFSVVLMIDTSASTTVEKMRQVQDAAVAFINQLREGDRVKVISFDDEVQDLCDFTNDRGRLASVIRSTQPGKGTRLYDAFDLALRSLARLKGRKAVIMLTDGMDFHSDRRTYDDNRRLAEESGVIVYPVRFDTRAETEQLAREQARGGSGPADLGTILGKIPGVPGNVRIDPRRGRGRTEPDDRRPDGTPDATSRYPGEGPGTSPTLPRDRDEASDLSIKEMLDNLYKLADDYLNEMARTTGGRLVRADNPLLLQRSFREIADELRTQYSLGYYPTNRARDGKYRKIRVRTTRKEIALRTRPGYRARRSF